MGFPFEELIRRKAGQERSDNAAGDLGQSHDDGCLGNGKAFVLGQESRAPVQDGETDDIYKYIGKGQNPDIPVLENHRTYQTLVSQVFKFFRFGFDLFSGEVFVQLFRIGQADRCRVVP